MRAELHILAAISVFHTENIKWDGHFVFVEVVSPTNVNNDLYNKPYWEP